MTRAIAVCTCFLTLLVSAQAFPGVKRSSSGGLPKQVKALEKQRKQEIAKHIVQLEGMMLRLEELARPRDYGVRLLDELDKALETSSGVWLSRLSWDGASATLDGTALSLRHVKDFAARRLDSHGIFDEVQIRSGEKVAGPDRDYFTYSLQVATAFEKKGKRPPFKTNTEVAVLRLIRLSDEKLKARLSAARQKEMDSGLRLPRRPHDPKVLENLSQSSRSSGLEVVSFKVEDVLDRGWYGEQPYLLTLRGPFENFARLFERLSRHPHLNSLSSLHLERYRQKEGKVTLEGKVRFLFYLHMDRVEEGGK